MSLPICWVALYLSQLAGEEFSTGALSPVRLVSGPLCPVLFSARRARGFMVSFSTGSFCPSVFSTGSFFPVVFVPAFSSWVLFSQGVLLGWDTKCPTGSIFKKLIHNAPHFLSHNNKYILFTPYSLSNGNLLCEAGGGTSYVWELYFLDSMSFSPSPYPTPPRLNVVKLNWGRLAAPLTSRHTFFYFRTGIL